MKSLREVMDGTDWSGWATKPHGPTQLPRPTADNESRPAAHALSGAEGEGMTDAEELDAFFAMHLGYVSAGRRGHLREVYARLLAAAEARGFVRARERAARAVEMAPASFNRNDHAERIRAMQDEE